MSLGMPLFGTLIFFMNLGFLAVYIITTLYSVCRKASSEYEDIIVRDISFLKY